MKYNDRSKFLTLPDAILFDIDDTLYAYQPAHLAAARVVSEKVSSMYMISETDFNKAYDEARMQIKAQLGRTASSHSRLLYYQRALELLGLSNQILTALDLEQSYWRSFLLKAKLFENVIETLNEIRLHGIPLALVTDLTAQIQMRKIVFFKLDQYVDYLVTSEESGSDKFAPASYQLALAKLGISKGCVWMIGDNPEADISGAKQAIGAITIQKLHKGVKQSKSNLPDASFTNFRELMTLISTLGRS